MFGRGTCISRRSSGAIVVALALSLFSRSGRAQTAAPEPSKERVVTQLPEALAERTGIDAINRQALGSGDATLEAYAGKPVRGVAIQRVGWRWSDTFDVEKLVLDKALDGHLIRKAIGAIMRTGRAAQVQVRGEAMNDGVKLTFSVVSRRLVADLRINQTPLDANTVSRATGLSKGAELTEEAITTAVANIQTLFMRQGYAQTLVSVTTRDTDDPLRVLVQFTVSAGEARTISRRTFYIEPKFVPLIGALKHSYAVPKGARVDEEALDEADTEMAEALRSQGFFDAKVSHQIEYQQNGTFLFVHLDSGPKYELTFSGHRVFSPTELREALDIETSERADPTELVGRIKALYQTHGWYDARVRLETRAFHKRGRVSLEFHIIEGQPLKIVSRQFPCFPPGGEAGLSRADLNREIDAVLEEALPKSRLLGEVDQLAVEQVFNPKSRTSLVRGALFEPSNTYTPAAYARAIEHLKKLLNARGYANARVGPATLVRAECDLSTRGSQCGAIALPRLPPGRCAVDALDLPTAEPPLDPSFTCVSNPKRSLSCAPTARMRIPILLGPRTVLYDIAFEGQRTVTAEQLAAKTDLKLGEEFSNQRVDTARQRLLNVYHNQGHHYASVDTRIEQSPDKTRARARFLINEGQPVVIRDYVVQGTRLTDPALILSRLALCYPLDECTSKQRYYRRDLVTKSEEQIAKLGVFSSVSISLENPEIPETNKRVLIHVVEERSQYLEPRIGFSTGDGLRTAFEYGHRNIGGKAIGLTLRLEFNYLPDALILDGDVRKNYVNFSVADRLERRNSISVRIPEIGLGPKVELLIDGVDVRDNQRDFGLTREALLPSLNYEVTRHLRLEAGASVEVNDVTLFNDGGLTAAIATNPSLANLLRVPEGRTIAIAQRLTATWDLRNDPFAATKGTLLTATAEHVTALPLEDESEQLTQLRSEFLRLRGRFAGYIPFTDRGLALALSLEAGYNLQLRTDSQTYPDRLFFLGGVNTVRGFLLDSLVPADLARQVQAAEITIDDVGVRGANLFINPRVELRVPITDTFNLGLFADAGNLWRSTDTIASISDLLELRYAAGAGLRIGTPIGPVALDYGINLNRRSWEDFGALHFSIGLF